MAPIRRSLPMTTATFRAGLYAAPFAVLLAFTVNAVRPLPADSRDKPSLQSAAPTQTAPVSVNGALPIRSGLTHRPLHFWITVSNQTPHPVTNVELVQVLAPGYRNNGSAAEPLA